MVWSCDATDPAVVTIAIGRRRCCGEPRLWQNAAPFALRFAKAPASLPLLIVLVDPQIEIGLQLVDRTIDLLAERDTVELIERGFVEALADAASLRDRGDWRTTPAMNHDQICSDLGRRETGKVNLFRLAMPLFGQWANAEIFSAEAGASPSLVPTTSALPPKGTKQPSGSKIIVALG